MAAGERGVGKAPDASSTLRRLVAVAAVVAASLSGAPWAIAQDGGTARPYQGLFEPDSTAGAAAGRQVQQAFAYSARVFEQVAFQRGSAFPNGGPWQSDYSAVDLTLTARHAGTRLRSELRGGGQLRAYHDTRGGAIDQQWAAIDLDAGLTKRTALAVTARTGYAASYAPASPLAGALEPDGSASASGAVVEFAALRNFNVVSTARVSRRVGRRTDADLGLGLGVVRYLDTGVMVTSRRASAGVQRRVRDGLSLDVGYDVGRVSSVRGEGRRETDSHELNVAARFSPSSSASTSVVIAAVPTLARLRAFAALPSPSPAQARGYTARLGALLAVDHRLSRRTRIRLGYQQALYSDDGYAQPSFTRTGGGQLELALSRRVAVSGAAAYSMGLLSAAVPGTSLDRIDARARLGVRTSSLMELSIEYQFSEYREHQGVRPTGVHAGGQTLRMGVTLAPASR